MAYINIISDKLKDHFSEYPHKPLCIVNWTFDKQKKEWVYNCKIGKGNNDFKLGRDFALKNHAKIHLESLKKSRTKHTREKYFLKSELKNIN